MGSGHAHPAPLAASCLGRLDARAKILAIIPAIVAINLLPAGRWPAAAGIGALFLAGLLVCGHGATAVLKRSLVLLPFLAFVVVTLPFAMPGEEVFSIGWRPVRFVATDEGFRRAGQVAVRGAASILGVLLLSGSTEAPALFKGLRMLGAPRAFVTVLAMIYRYLFQMGDEFSKVRRAAAARGFAVNDFRAVPRLGNMAASLLVRSVERSQRVHHAMLARGFDGEVRVLTGRDRAHFGAREWLFLVGFYAVSASVLLLAIYA